MPQPDPRRVVARWLRVSSWMRVKRFIGVSSPLFHATSGPKAANIALRAQGIKVDSGFSDFGGGGNQNGVSMTRDLAVALKGNFGNMIFVFDRNQLKTRFPIRPNAYEGQGRGFWAEAEERVLTDKGIPLSMIRGVIFGGRPPLRFILDEWAGKVSFPVVYKSKTTGKWETWEAS